jgi:hypothetical protein
MDQILVETRAIDRRYEHCRARHSLGEGVVLQSVRMHGVKEPLLGILKGGTHILLDGFKRLRVGITLGLDHLPFRALADHEAAGLLALIKLSSSRSLTMLEQALMIDELTKVHALTVTDIAKQLEKSVAWVSMRHGILAELSPKVRDKIMDGDFPMYSYMYHVRPFMRMKRTKPEDLERFVGAVSGRGLSTRDIEVLSKAFFKGGDEVRRQILQGSIAECLLALRPKVTDDWAASKEERRVILDLGIVAEKMRLLSRVRLVDESPDFRVRAELLCQGILRVMGAFQQAIRGLYDRAGAATCSAGDGGEGDVDSRDWSASGDFAQHHEGHLAARGRRDEGASEGSRHD